MPLLPFFAIVLRGLAESGSNLEELHLVFCCVDNCICHLADVLPFTILEKDPLMSFGSNCENCVDAFFSRLDAVVPNPCVQPG